MKKLNSVDNHRINYEIHLLTENGGEEAFNILKNIAAFLKENDHLLGYANGVTASLLNIYEIGLSNINPSEFGLIPERIFTPKPHFKILLNKESYQKTNTYLKANKISKTKLGNYNIEIKYDKRLDKTKHHKKYSFQSLSKLAVKETNEQSIFHVKDFNDYVDIFSINNAFGLQSYWFQELSCNSYNSLANSYSFLQTNNLFNVILFQEEWMTIIKKITDLSYFEINLFRKAVGRKIPIKKIERIIKTNLKEKFKISVRDYKQIYDTLMSCIHFLPCKAHIASEAYIEIVTKND